MCYTPASLHIILGQYVIDGVATRYTGVWLHGGHHGLRMARRSLVILGRLLACGSPSLRELTLALSLLSSLELPPYLLRRDLIDVVVTHVGSHIGWKRVRSSLGRPKPRFGADRDRWCSSRATATSLGRDRSAARMYPQTRRTVSVEMRWSMSPRARRSRERFDELGSGAGDGQCRWAVVWMRRVNAICSVCFTET